MDDSLPTYIIAVSGGVDSCVLLHMLVNDSPEISEKIHSGSTLVVAHVNHGIRDETSVRDQAFVKDLADHYGLQFETCVLSLGPDASEELARNSRYDFFETVAQKYRARGTILAHHGDDVIETAIINYIRGTGRRGYSSLSSTEKRVRPLLHMTKKQILEYAHANNLEWVEDETNDDQKYLRNRIRSKLNTEELSDTKLNIASELQKIKDKNATLDFEIAKILQYKLRDKFIVSRSWFVKLPHDVSCEIMHAIVSKLGVASIDRKLIEKLVISTKVARAGTKVDVDKNTVALFTKRSLRFTSRETLKTHTV